jgi:hypothetical protein
VLVIDNTQDSEQILSQKTVDYMNYCLDQAVDHGTGTMTDIDGIDVCGKTGTTNSKNDRYFCGFTGYYTAAVWCGFEQPAEINLVGDTRHPAGVLWHKVMAPLHKGKDNIKLYNKDKKMVSVTVCLDSGDLAYLSKEARKQLDAAGLSDCKIVASNGLDEYTINSLNRQGALIDIYGVGEKLITTATNPVFGAVYKLVAVKKNGEFQPKIKISETVEKITNPGIKELYRVYDNEGKAVADYLTVQGEVIDTSAPVRYVDPLKYWKNRSFEDCTFKKLHQQIFKDGELVYELPKLDDIRKYVRHQLDNEIWQEEQRFENSHPHYLDMSPAMFELKMGLLHECSK